MDVKCPDSGEADTFNEKNLDAVDEKDEIKFVLSTRRDYEFARDFTRERGLAKRVKQVLFSPVFADPEGKKDWKEYGTLKEVPTLANDAGKYAGLLPGVDGNSLIVTEEPGEDFTAYTYYCLTRRGI